MPQIGWYDHPKDPPIGKPSCMYFGRAIPFIDPIELEREGFKARLGILSIRSSLYRTQEERKAGQAAERIVEGITEEFNRRQQKGQQALLDTMKKQWEAKLSEEERYARVVLKFQ